MQGTDEAGVSLRGAGVGWGTARLLGFISGTGGAGSTFGFSSDASSVCMSMETGKRWQGKQCSHAGLQQIGGGEGRGERPAGRESYSRVAFRYRGSS